MPRQLYKLFSLLSLALVIAAGNAQTVAARPSAPINGYQPKWWKEAVIYQIYPRSFKDSNGDGIGDLNGITSKLDYLQHLGVNVIWLSPHYDSPNADNGYDIRDYRKIMTEFGTMPDFDRMLAQIKQRHMRLIIDLVVNHTSDEHRWFEASKSSKDNPYRDYYIWRPGKPDPSAPAANGAPAGLAPPNNYPSFFSGSAWQYNPPTQDFYLHLFAIKQPDLNWDTPKVRQEVYSLMKFWLDKGVDGFRMDVIPLISKQPGLPDLSPQQLRTGSYVALWANGPNRDQYLQEMNREVLSKYDDMSVGEAIGINLDEEHQIVGADRHELSMIFNFDAIRINRARGYTERKWTLPELKTIYDDHSRILTKQDWDTVFIANHDNPRMVSNFGDDSLQYRAISSKLLQTMILTLRGTPFLYQGDELGMTNYPFKNLADFNDIEVKNAYQERVVQKKEISLPQFIAESARFGRDNSRTPMQWSHDTNAGFTTGSTPWLAVNPNYPEINVATEQADPTSVLNYVTRLIALHQAHPAFTYGDYQDLDPNNEQIYAYTRTLPNEKLLVILNFSGKPANFTVPANIKPATLLLTNTQSTKAPTLNLQPWEARIYTYTTPTP